MKALFWVLFVLAMVLYAIVVYGWWQEGNLNATV